MFPLRVWPVFHRLSKASSPDTASGSQDGWWRFAGKGDKALAGNRVTAGKATIVARDIAVLAALQIDLEMFTEWEAQLVPRRLEVPRLQLCHCLSPMVILKCNA